MLRVLYCKDSSLRMRIRVCVQAQVHGTVTPRWCFAVWKKGSGRVGGCGLGTGDGSVQSWEWRHAAMRCSLAALGSVASISVRFRLACSHRLTYRWRVPMAEMDGQKDKPRSVISDRLPLLLLEYFFCFYNEIAMVITTQPHAFGCQAQVTIIQRWPSRAHATVMLLLICPWVWATGARGQPHEQRALPNRGPAGH